MNTITVKDHSVSGEEFQLLYNQELDMYKTHPQPALDVLGSYYESEDYISHTDTQRNLFEKVYHWVRSYMLSKKVKLVNTYTNTQEKNLLDIGCGTGDFLKAAKNKGWKITGIEPDAKAREIAAKKTESNIHTNDWLDTAEENSFDVITMWHVLEHVPDVEKQIKTLKRVLKENGTIIIAVPNFKSHDAKYYDKFWAAFDVPRHLSHFSQKSMEVLFGKETMNVVKILPMKFDAYYVSLLSEKIKTGKMNPLKAFYRGFISNMKAKRSSEYSSLIYVIKNK